MFGWASIEVSMRYRITNIRLQWDVWRGRCRTGALERLGAKRVLKPAARSVGWCLQERWPKRSCWRRADHLSSSGQTRPAPVHGVHERGARRRQVIVTVIGAPVKKSPQPN